MTLTEIMVVLAIVCVLAALLFPVTLRAKEGGNQTACVSNLKQIGTAIELYREECDGAQYSTAAGMGLPPFILPATTVLHCHANPHQDSWPYIQLWQGYVASDPQNTWRNLVDQYQDGTPLVLDINHNDPSIPMFSPYFDRVGLVLFLGGDVKKLKRRGDINAPSTWAEK